MAAPKSESEPILDLEQVAVGPYCVFDPFSLSPTRFDGEHSPAPLPSAQGKSRMDDASALNNFPFGSNMRSPWVVSSSEDASLVGHPLNDFGQESWNEWMGWDASQDQSPKPLNTQGPLALVKSESSRSPFLARRPNSTLHDPSMPLSSAPNSRPLPAAMNNPSFSFGGAAEIPPAFSFKPVSTSSSSPVLAGVQANAFPSGNPSWDQVRQFDHSNTVSPTGFEQSQPGSSMGIPPLNTPSLHHSPSSLTNAHTSPSSAQSSPEPSGSGTGRKRKSSENDIDELSPSGQSNQQPPIKKTAHNMIEKRYRTNLNDKIAALRDSVPSLRVISRNTTANGDEDDPEDLEGLTPAHKLNKATVLSKATEYIHHLEKRIKRMQDELTDYKNRMDAYEKLAVSGPMRLPNAMATPDDLRYQADPFSSISVQGPPVSQGPQGLIPVPESLASLHRAAQTQQHYAYSQTGAAHSAYSVQAAGPPRQAVPPPPPQHQPLQIMNGRRVTGHSMMGKLMVGSLAGLMIMEGWSEREKPGKEPNGRGLFSLPLSLFSRPGHAFLGLNHPASFEQTMLMFVRSFLLVFALVYLISPLLHIPRGSKKKTVVSGDRLTPAPSLASPVEVRRKAWLTAIQTVWVPQHNFFLEAAALGLKTLKLSTRNLIGWNGYALLTGITREQEAARVKAWEIALDAQLTGGDAEISNNRLLLTLMASGTLPDSPARLMLKSLHLRVLLWGYAKAGYGTWYMFEELSAKLARRYWNKAREEHRVMMNSKENQEDRLPPHLAALVELDCDDVLVHSIIQRVYNVAWNKPTTDMGTVDDSLDSVVEDFAISSPLDALAAWWSSTILSRALVAYLDSENQEITEDVMDALQLALDTAPPLSGAQLRAMVARAILLDEGRKENIAAALKALPVQMRPMQTAPVPDIASSPSPLMTIPNNLPAAPDFKKSLTIGKCLCLAQEANETGSRQARLRAASAINHGDLPPHELTLLSLVATYKLLLEFSRDETLLAETRIGLERFANSVRVWVGRDTGRRSGISSKARGMIIEKCLSVSKLLVGIHDANDEVDAGYVSGNEGHDEPRKR